MSSPTATEARRTRWMTHFIPGVRRLAAALDAGSLLPAVLAQQAAR
jgi:hypothetical protein